MVSQLHHLLLELIPGDARMSLSAAQATALLAKVGPGDAAGEAALRPRSWATTPRNRSFRTGREGTEVIAQ
jgi:hypothetical protein